MSVVSLAEVKRHLNYDDSNTDDDVYFGEIIDAVSDWAGEYLNRPVARGQCDFHFDGDGDFLQIDETPIHSVDSVAVDGALLDTSLWSAHYAGVASWRTACEVWPEGDGWESLVDAVTHGRPPIRVRCQVGWTASEIPKGMRHGMLKIIEDMVNARGYQLPMRMTSIVGATRHLLDVYRRVSF